VGAGTVALALVALTVAWIRAPGGIGGPKTVPVALLALGLVVATVVASRFPIHIRRKTKVYMSSVPFYLLAVLVPSALAATAAGMGALLGELSMRAQRGNSAGDIASEVGRRVLVVLLGALVAHLPGAGALHTVLLVGTALVLGAGDIVSCPLVLTPMTGEPPLQVIVEFPGFDDEAFHIDGHAGGPIGFELGQAVSEFRHGASPVSPSPVVEADADLQDALVEVADGVRFMDPNFFERFVLLEELMPVELLDAAKEPLGRWILATARTSRRGLRQPDAQARAPATAETRAISPSGEAVGSSK